MRKTAGILMIILGVFSVMVPGSIADMIAWARAASFEEFRAIRTGMDDQIAFPSLLLMVFIVGSGISALKKKSYWWALSGAIISVIGGITLFMTTVMGSYFGLIGTPIAVLALVLLVSRRGEFEGSGLENADVCEELPTERQRGRTREDYSEAAEPRLGRGHTSRNHDAAGTKAGTDERPFAAYDGAVYTPSLMATMVVGLLKDSKLQDQVQTALGTPLDRRQRFNLAVFESYCYFTAINTAAKTKQGYQDRVVRALKGELLARIAESFGERVLGIDDGESARLLRDGAEALYSQFDRIAKDLGTDTPSQMRSTIALAYAVYGDKQANISSGLPLYGQLMTKSLHMQRAFGAVFLIDEGDCD